MGVGAILQALNITDLVSSIIGAISGVKNGMPTKVVGTGQHQVSTV